VKRLVIPIVALSSLCVSIVPAHAQERGQVGIVMAVPTDVGLMWHLSEKIAFRPEMSFNFLSSDVEAGGTNVQESSGREFGLEASVLFYLNGADSLRTYVSPRVAYAWSSEEDDDSADDASNDGFELSASFGAEYSPVPRFSVFGEIGLEYARSTSTFSSGSGEIERSGSSWAPRTMVGVTYYFGGN
jgi:hypothetical protein